MQRGKRSRGGAGKVVRPAAKAAAPAQHPEGVLDIAAVAAGIDVHKMGLTVTLLSEDAGGEVLTETRAYRTYGRELEEFATWLAGWQPGRVMMESTGVYWKCIHSALERHGVSAWVVNARHVKRVPGRKDDVTDSVWLATLARYGLARPSFVPDARLEELRQLTRLHTRLRGVATKLKGMLHRLLDESGIRLGGILTDVLGVSGQRLLEGLAEGHDPEAMLLGVKGPGAQEAGAVAGRLAAGACRRARSRCCGCCAGSGRRRRGRCGSWSGASWRRRSGSGRSRGSCCRRCRGRARWRRRRCWRRSGMTWSASGRRGGWRAGRACARGGASRRASAAAGGRARGTAICGRILCEIAHAAARTKDVQFGPLKKGLTVRRGGRRAIVAVGHKILRIAFAMLRDREPYKDPDLDYDQLLAQRNRARWVAALRKAKLLPAAEAATGAPAAT